MLPFDQSRIIKQVAFAVAVASTWKTIGKTIKTIKKQAK